MKLSTLVLAASTTVLAFAQGACSSDGFGRVPSGMRLVVELRETPLGRIEDPNGDNTAFVGSRLAPLPLVVDAPQPFKLVVRALDRFGNPDPSFNGYVRISAKPGAVEPVTGAGGDGRNLKLTDGASEEVAVSVTNAYGTTYILADDIGYQPADALGEPRPQCANGIDDDGDGLIDFPADDGCAFANDGTEAGGTYEQGASHPIFYQLPRIADARGLRCLMAGDGSVSCSGSGRTPYPGQQLFLDTGYHDKRDEDGIIIADYDFDLVVTRIATNGFYVTDTSDTRGGFNSAFAFNFNAPPGMRVCDRLKSFAGTAGEFFGLTQISYPTWTLEEWRKGDRPCGVPEPRVLMPSDIEPTSLLPLTSSLVRVRHQLNDAGVALSEVRITPKFGPGYMPCVNELGEPLDVRSCIDDPLSRFVPAVEAGTDCDLNHDGEIQFFLPKLPGDNGPSKESKEGVCSKTCQADAECTEYSNFASRSTFRLTAVDALGVKSAIQANATAAAEFHPLEQKGQPLKSFTGTLHFFSGGAQYTIEARCQDDIVVDMNAEPLPPDAACVFPRTDIDENPQ